MPIKDIKVWMLTGDKLETAENIAKSCALIQKDFSILHLYSQPTSEKMKDKMIELYEIIKMNNSTNQKKGLLVEGSSITQIFAEEILKDIFLDIIENCETVICCRVSPKQKAQVVKLVKEYLGKITLAVGDGANDVNMIQEADIGIGIYGLEGRRAVQVSDFAIGEFQYLWKLIIVHGRWCYLRIAEMILYFFYKNMVFTVIHFYYSFVCAYSGQSIYDDSYIVFFNLIFTSLPLMIRAIFEKDIYYMVRKNKYEGEKFEMKELAMVKKAYPKFYYQGQKKKLFNTKRYVNWVVQGLVHGAIIFTLCCVVFYYNILNLDGYTNDLWLLSIYLYSCLILVVDLKLALYTQAWSIFFIIALVVTSLVFYFMYILISSEISSLQVFATSFMLYQSPSFYFLMFLNVGFVCLFDLVIVYLKQNYKSGPIEKSKLLMKKNPKAEEILEQKFIEEMIVSQKNSAYKKKNNDFHVNTEEIPFNKT